MFSKMESDLDFAKAHSVYDAANWNYTGIHDDKFVDRLHELEISIKSQKQSFSVMDQHILLCLFNYSSSLKGSNLKEIDDIEAFFSFFKHYVDELIQAQSMKSQQFFNEMKNMQSRDYFYKVLDDLVENRLVYCGFMTYRTDSNKKIKNLSLFENTSSLPVYLTIELQKHYRGMQDYYQRVFPRLDGDDIEVDQDQLDHLDEIVEEIRVDDTLNKTRLDEMFQLDYKIYKLTFPDNSYFFIHSQGLLELPRIIQKKMFEVYKYYYLRRTVETFIKKLMDTIIIEINKLKKSGLEYSIDTVYRIFQEGSWNKDTLLPWYYWSFVVSEKLGNQKKVKKSLSKYYQSAYFLKSYLHLRAKSIEENGTDPAEDQPQESSPKIAPVSITEKLSDINALLKMMHEKPDFYTFDSLSRLGFNLGIKEKYDSPANDGYSSFIKFFLDKATSMVSKKTNTSYVREITVGSEEQEVKYYVYYTDLGLAFLQKRDTVANGFGFHYAEVFSTPNLPINNQAELNINVEDLTRNREPLFYKLYVSHIQEIFTLLTRLKDLHELELLFVNMKPDAPRALAEILGLNFHQLQKVGEVLEQKHREQSASQENLAGDQNAQAASSEETSGHSKMNEMRKAMRQSQQDIAGNFSLLDWLLGLLGLGRGSKKRRKQAAQLNKTGASLSSARGSWRARLGKAFNSAIDNDLKMKRKNAKMMKNLFGGESESKLSDKSLQDKAFKKQGKKAAATGGG